MQFPNEQTKPNPRLPLKSINLTRFSSVPQVDALRLVCNRPTLALCAPCMQLDVGWVSQSARAFCKDQPKATVPGQSQPGSAILLRCCFSLPSGCRHFARSGIFFCFLSDVYLLSGYLLKNRLLSPTGKCSHDASCVRMFIYARMSIHPRLHRHKQ